MTWKKIVGLLLVGGGLVVLALQLGHYYDLTPAVKRWSTKAGPAVTKTIDRIQPGRAVYIFLIGLPVCAGALFLFASKSKSQPGEKVAVEKVPAEEVAVHRPIKATARNKTYHACNVLQVGPQSRQIWQFDARNGGFVLNRQQISLPGEPLPKGLVAKDLRSLFQRKLNVAWLPPENVFLRVAQLPHSEFNETLAMVELQLEKLSPLPVAQIVWSIQVLPHSGGNMQTVVVIIVARNVVEEFLGQLEGQGYLADRLELRVLDQLNATAINEDGAWIYPEALGSQNTALVAWWYGGVLQNLDFVTLASENRPEAVQEQLTQMAWAGEMEGWLKSPPHFHLVASGPTASEWETALRSGLDQPIQVLEPLPPPQLAAATARRATQASPNANLLPAEFATRYHQQFVDRLWMRGLLAAGGLYLLYIVGYGSVLGVNMFQTSAVESKKESLAAEYTNTMQLKATYQVLKERQDLKFAGLDCWRAIAELMPETLSLESWNFGEGKRLVLNGSAPSSEHVQEVLDFEKAVRKYMNPKDPSQPMFDPNKGEYLNWRKGPNDTILWSFSVELKRSEALQ
jgi:hypothetical protein